MTISSTARRWAIFLRLCIRFAFADAASAAFSWGTVPGAAIIAGAIKAWGLKVPSSSPSDVLVAALAGAFAASLIPFVLSLCWSAPRKAWMTEHPLVLEITDQKSSPTLVQDVLQKHIVSLVVKNRSPINSAFCTVSVSEVIGKTDFARPWQIYSGNIPCNDRHYLPLAHWFYAVGAREDQKIAIFNEQSGALASSSLLQLPQTGADVCILVRSPDLPEIKRWCRIWVSQQEKRLLLCAIEDPSA